MADLALDYRRVSAPRISIGSVITVVFGHAAAIAVLISLDPVPNPLEIEPLRVQMIPSVKEPRPPAPKVNAPQPMMPARQPAAEPTRSAQALANSGDVIEKVMVTEPPPTAKMASTEAVVSQPRFDADYLDNPPPPYPALSRRLREEGKVFLRVFVEADGHAGRIEVKTTSGSPRLDQAAEQAVWKWKFIPAKRGNEPFGAWIVVPISFNLKA